MHVVAVVVVATNTPFSYQTNETKKKKYIMFIKELSIFMENNEIALKNYKLFPF